MKVRNSQPFVMIIFIISIIIIGMAYVILQQPLSTTYDYAYNDSNLNDQVYQTFFMQMKTIWIWVLFPIVIALIWWSVMKSIEKGYIP